MAAVISVPLLVIAALAGAPTALGVFALVDSVVDRREYRPRWGRRWGTPPRDATHVENGLML